MFGRFTVKAVSDVPFLNVTSHESPEPAATVDLAYMFFIVQLPPIIPARALVSSAPHVTPPKSAAPYSVVDAVPFKGSSELPIIIASPSMSGVNSIDTIAFAASGVPDDVRRIKTLSPAATATELDVSLAVVAVSEMVAVREVDIPFLNTR